MAITTIQATSKRAAIAKLRAGGGGQVPRGRAKAPQGRAAAPQSAPRGRGRGGNSVGQFLRLHTGRQAGKIANAQASTEFNPEIRSLRQQAKGSAARQGQIGDWYNQLAQDYAQAQTAGQTAFQSAQDATSKQLAEAAERSKGQQGELSKSDEEFAKLVGGPKDTAGLQKIAEAGAAAERSRVALNAPTATEGANYVASLGGMKTAARMKGIEARGEEAKRREKLISNLTAARKEKGSARVTATEKLRQSDRAYSSELKQQRQQRREFAQQKREAAVSAQQAAASMALDQANLARQVQEGRITTQQAQERIAISRRNAKTSEKSGASGGLTPGERNTNKKEFQNAASLVHTAITNAGPPKNAADANSLETETLAHANEIGVSVSPRAVHRAVQQALKGQKAKQAKRPKRKSIVGTVLHPGTTTR